MPLLSHEENEKTQRTSASPAEKRVPAPHQTTIPTSDRKKTKDHRKSLSLADLIPFSTKESATLNVNQQASKDMGVLSHRRPETSTAAPPSPFTPTRILAWAKRLPGNNGHRHKQSVTSVSLPTTPIKPKPYLYSMSASASPVVATTRQNQSASMSPMTLELLKLKQETRDTDDSRSLFLPSLAEPRPTSFLTGLEEGLRSSEQHATAWQLEIPSYKDVLTSTRLCQFMETYRAEECLLDLQQLVGVSNMDLSRFARGYITLKGPTFVTNIAEYHRPIVESLVECSDDISGVKGFFTSKGKKGSPDSRREVLIVERQNKFICVFRGTTSEQQGKVPKQHDTISPNDGHKAVVYADRYSAFAELQTATFQLLDELTEENPFCDIAFTGHAFGAAMATLAAYMYAITRTSIRVTCCVSASSKVGPTDFRWEVHSTPNLNMWQLEFARLNPRNYVGHHFRLSAPTNHKANPVVQSYKFGGLSSQDNQLPLHPGGGAGAVFSFLSSTKQKEKNVNEYVSLLEGVDSSEWVKCFYKEDGEGVRGKDDEAREMA